MAKSGGAGRSGAGRSGAGRPRGARRTPTPAPRQAPRPKRPAPTPEASAPPVRTEPFRLGAVPGATPGTWIDKWQERRPNPLELVPLEAADAVAALRAGAVDAAILRRPTETEGLHVIGLYEELPVVVAAKDSHLTAADELDLADLAGEVLIVPADDVLGMPALDGTETPRFAAPATTEDAIATVATGVGIVIVPMSLARLYHRRDTDYRVLRGGPVSPVALAWVAERTTDDVEAFVGIVRGRTANSSR